MILLELGKRIVQGTRQWCDLLPERLILLGYIHVERPEMVLSHVGLRLDAVEPRHEHGGERQINVAREIRRAELDSLVALADGVPWNTNCRRPIPQREEQVHRCLIPLDQTLERVRRRITQPGQRPTVLQQATDVLQRRSTQVPISCRCAVVKDISPGFGLVPPPISPIRDTV